MVRDEGDGPGQVLAGRLGPGAVEEGKGIVPPAGELQGVGEAVLHGPHVGKAAAGVAEGHLAPGVPPEEEEAGVRLVWVGGLFLGGVDVVEHRLPCCGLGVEVVDNGHGLLRVDVVVPGQAEVPQGVPAPVPRVRGEEEAAIVPEHGVVHHGLDGGVGGVRACGHGGSLLWGGLGGSGGGGVAVRRRSAAPGQEQAEGSGDAYQGLHPNHLSFVGFTPIIEKTRLPEKSRFFMS